MIFRFDRVELEKALEAAVTRGVVVRALIAHTNRGGEKSLRRLELRLLDAGVTVARTADDLPRYHGKLLIVDDVLYVFGFNYTKLDIEKSRSFGIMTRDKRLVKEACCAVRGRQHPAALLAESRSFRGQPGDLARAADRIHPAGEEAAADLRRQVSDNLIQRVLQDRMQGGRRDPRHRQDREEPPPASSAASSLDLRLHVRAIVRDGNAVLRRQPEPAEAGARRASRSRRDHHRLADREEGAGGLRGGLGPDGSGLEAGGKGKKGEGEERRTLLLLPSLDDAGVDHRTGAGDRVEEELVAVDLRHQERLSVSNPLAVRPVRRSMLPFRSCPPDPVTK